MENRITFDRTYSKEAVIDYGNIYGLENQLPIGWSRSHHKAGFYSTSALAFMTFTLLYVPCVSTLATTRREMNSRKWTAFAVAWQLSMAYIVSFIVYNVARLV